MENQRTYKNPETLRGMLGLFYNRQMKSIIAITWFWAIVVIIIAVFSASAFFRASETKQMILYASIFICSVIFLSIIKVFAWQIINRRSLQLEIERLENKIDKLLSSAPR